MDQMCHTFEHLRDAIHSSMCDIHSFRLSSTNPIKRKKWSISAFYALLNSRRHCHPFNFPSLPPPSTFGSLFSAFVHHIILQFRTWRSLSVGRVKAEHEKSALVADRTATCRLAWHQRESTGCEEEEKKSGWTIQNQNLNVNFTLGGNCTLSMHTYTYLSGDLMVL